MTHTTPPHSRILTAARLACLGTALAGLLLLTSGCGKLFRSETSPPTSKVPTASGPKKWASDPQADAAMQRENYVEAIRLLLAFIESNPDNGLAYYHLGFAFGRSGDPDSEIKYYEQAVNLGYTENNIFYNLGMAYGGRKQYDKAERMFQGALALDKSDAEPHFGLGLLCQSRGDDARAEHELLQAIALDPDHLEARATLAMSYAKTGKREQAIEQLKVLLSKDPNHRLGRELMQRLGAQ
jgi:tetratricopeptide (TPR) repeat protein